MFVPAARSNIKNCNFCCFLIDFKWIFASKSRFWFDFYEKNIENIAKWLLICTWFCKEKRTCPNIKFYKFRQDFFWSKSLEKAMTFDWFRRGDVNKSGQLAPFPNDDFFPKPPDTRQGAMAISKIWSFLIFLLLVFPLYFADYSFPL